MRNPDGARVRVCGWCMATALVLVLAPVGAIAGPPNPDAEQPVSPDADPVPPPETPPVAPDGIFEPIDIPAPPEQPKPEPPPAPTVEPASPVEVPQAPADPEQLEKIQRQRKAGIAVMAAGGAVAATGFGLTLAFTLLGDRAQRVDEPEVEDIERNDSLAQAGGIVLASGVALVVVGGILFANANKKAEKRKYEATSRVRLVPAVGGLVLSGQF
jgi:hypothetical protein